MLNEAPLHASLKALYAQPSDTLEAPIDGFVVDILQADGIIEIQTGSFGNMKRKLHKLLDDYRIRVVYPIAHERWIIKLPVSIAALVKHPNFELEMVLIREEQIRRFDGNKSWRRRDGRWMNVDCWKLSIDV